MRNDIEIDKIKDEIKSYTIKIDGLTDLVEEKINQTKYFQEALN